MERVGKRRERVTERTLEGDRRVEELVERLPVVLLTSFSVLDS